MGQHDAELNQVALPLWGKRVNEDQFPDKSDAIRVHAVGEQFAWNFHYPGPDGVFGRRDASRPVNATV